MTTNHLEKLDSALIRPGRIRARFAEIWSRLGYKTPADLERRF